MNWYCNIRKFAHLGVCKERNLARLAVFGVQNCGVLCNSLIERVLSSGLCRVFLYACVMCELRVPATRVC